MLEPKQRFTERAADYVVGRPSYPDEAISELFDGLPNAAALTAVDLGAGTGISSRLLAAHAGKVIAVEPNAQMQANAAPHANIVWQDGTAESTGLADGCADLVTAFQAFHWFDPVRALPEMLRILRPGGRAALVYNERDESDAFTAAYGDLVRRFATDATELRRDDGRETFAAFSAWSDVRLVAFPNVQLLDLSGLHARARSTSYLPHDGPTATSLHSEIDALFAEHAIAAHISMRMRTILSLAQPIAPPVHR